MAVLRAGQIANYYEYHFLYVNGIHHVESKNVQGVSLLKLYFHPGTDTAQAMGETVGYVNRSRAFMPPGTVNPFIMRFDTGSVPIGYLVMSSETRTIGEIQDKALFRVRPMFAAIEVVSAPPPFSGSQQTVVVRADPERLKAYNVSAADVVAAEARPDVAKADVRRVAALLAYNRVKAPYDGVVTRRTVNTGDYVTGDGKYGLFAVAKIDPVRVTLPATAGSPSVGKVVRTSWSLEPGSRTLRTEVDLPNPDGKLRPGMYVSAKLAVELPAEWSVPTVATGKINDEPVMYLAEGGKAVRVVVQLHRGDAQFTQILRYRRPGASDSAVVTGSEQIAVPASVLSDGQALP